MDDDKVNVSAIDERTWRIDEGGVRFFLVAGERRALLVDCGMHVHEYALRHRSCG